MAHALLTSTERQRLDRFVSTPNDQLILSPPQKRIEKKFRENFGNCQSLDLQSIKILDNISIDPKIIIEITITLIIV